jgi:hypothetical protein
MKLSIVERIYCIAILNGYQGTIDVMKKVLDDAGKLAISDKEKEEFDFKQDGNMVTWNPKKEKEVEIELSKDVKDFIYKTIKEKEKEGKITFEDKAAITLMEKL